MRRCPSRVTQCRKTSGASHLLGNLPCNCQRIDGLGFRCISTLLHLKEAGRHVDDLQHPSRAAYDHLSHFTSSALIPAGAGAGREYQDYHERFFSLAGEVLDLLAQRAFSLRVAFWTPAPLVPLQLDVRSHRAAGDGDSQVS